MSPVFRRSRAAAPASVVAAVVSLGLLAPRASAQEVSIATPDSGSARISGFGGLDWGSDRADVEARWGPPDTVRGVNSLRAEALIYAGRSILGEEGAMGFLVHPDSGLVRGLYLVPYGKGSDCQRLYSKFRDAIRRTLGGLEGEESRANRAKDLDFCTAFQLGSARAHTVWRDTARGTRAWVRLDRSVGALRVSFESRAFSHLRERARQRSTKRWLGGDSSGRADTVRIPADSLKESGDPMSTATDTAGGKR